MEGSRPLPPARRNVAREPSRGAARALAYGRAGARLDLAITRTQAGSYRSGFPRGEDVPSTAPGQRSALARPWRHPSVQLRLTTRHRTAVSRCCSSGPIVMRAVQRLQKVQGRSGRSRPARNCSRRSTFARSGRAIEITSHIPEERRDSKHIGRAIEFEDRMPGSGVEIPPHPIHERSGQGSATTSFERTNSPLRETRSSQSSRDPGLPWQKTTASGSFGGPDSMRGERTPEVVRLFQRTVDAGIIGPTSEPSVRSGCPERPSPPTRERGGIGD